MPALDTTHGNNGRMAAPEGIGYRELPLLAGRAKRALNLSLSLLVELDSSLSCNNDSGRSFEALSEADH